MAFPHRSPARSMLLPLALVWAVAPPTIFAGEKAEERLRSDAPKALAGLEESLATLECVGKQTFTVNGITSKFGSYRLKVRDAAVLLIRADYASDVIGPSPFRRLIYGANAEGSFLLREAADGTASNPYPEGSPSPRNMVENERRQWVEGLSKGHFGKNHTLRSALDDPGFRILRVAEEERDGRVHVRVNYEHSYETGKEGYTDQGWFLMAPHRRWAFLEFERRTRSRSDQVRTSLRYEYELADSPEGPPVMRKATYDLQTTGALNWSQRGVLEVSEWTYRAIPEAEFRAESYARPRE